MRTYLGVASQIDALHAPEFPLRQLGIEVDGLTARTLLWMAGPYEVRGDWILTRPARAVINDTKSILSAATDHGPAVLETVEGALAVFGIPSRELREWIVSVSSYRIESDLVLRWSGSMADKAVTVLGIAGRPLTGEELLDRVSPAGNLRSMLSQLGGDGRLKRTGVRHWGLQNWEHDEYTTVSDEIAQEIERQGGAASVEHLVEYISTVYGVAPNSIRSNASSPRFTRDGRGWVAIASADARRVEPKPPQEARSVYLIRNQWTYRQRVSGDLLRGSGFPAAAAFAARLGSRPSTHDCSKREPHRSLLAGPPPSQHSDQFATTSKRSGPSRVTTASLVSAAHVQSYG